MQLAQGTATAEEYRLLREMITADQSGELAVLANIHFSGQPGITSQTGDPTEYWQESIRKILSADKGPDEMAGEASPSPAIAPFRSLPFLRRWGWAAASILVLLATGAYFWLQQPGKPGTADTGSVRDIPPGKQGAILTLADGRTIALDSLRNGLVAAQGGVSVKLQDGKLVYDKHAGTAPAAGNVLYNIMATPKGRQYQLVLPDGTQVWLNAASSLRYPAVFEGTERTVEVTGEAYFEVAPNPKMPFRVKIGEGTVIEVLGTNFNVNAYSDEPGIHTTLLEGSVKISTQNRSQLLQPGQQVQIDKRDGVFTLIKEADVAQAIAWKEGIFSFTDASLETVMRQLARWYNVEVKYEGAIPQREFNGEINRGLTLAQVLKGLAKTKINYTIVNDNTILIQP